jgi:predicted RNase H-related nuclease YkuK (DUF458 family)
MEKEKLFTRGNRDRTKVTYDEMIDVIANYIAEDPDAEYDITIGTDSQNHKNTRIVEVIAVCRLGDGGKFFYFREDIPKIKVLKEKIIEETNRSIQNATGFIDKLQYRLIDFDIDLDKMFDENRLGFAVHADIGRRGKTKELIKEICAWIEASGFEARIKPDSYAASGVANMLSK